MRRQFRPVAVWRSSGGRTRAVGGCGCLLSLYTGRRRILHFCGSGGKKERRIFAAAGADHRRFAAQGAAPNPPFSGQKKKDLRVKSEVLFSEGLPAISNVRSLVRSVLHYELLQIRDILFDLIIEESKVLGV